MPSTVLDSRKKHKQPKWKFLSSGSSYSREEAKSKQQTNKRHGILDVGKC